MGLPLAMASSNNYEVDEISYWESWGNRTSGQYSRAVLKHISQENKRNYSLK